MIFKSCAVRENQEPVGLKDAGKMALNYIYHTVTTEPLQALKVAEQLRDSAGQIEAAGGILFGIWRSQIGRPRDELTVMTAWPNDDDTAATSAHMIKSIHDVCDCESERLLPTLKPETTTPPRKQGIYAFRWFDVPTENWDTFLDLCAAAWPGWEEAYASDIIGLWRHEQSDHDSVRTLLLSRRPSLAMWERTKKPESEEEIEVRKKMGNRYDLCTWTSVYTTTLVSTAENGNSDNWP